jgi:hypothetical protein
MCRTGRVRASRLAQENGRSVKKGMDNSMNVIHIICMSVYIRCGVAVLFTFILV